MSRNSKSKKQKAKSKKLVPALLAWFARDARDLPWRRTRDPYAIWVSEIMLQQTQVKTVLPYWTRWMSALPTIQALANAKPEMVIKLWEGLGYYTRARNLQKAAQEIVADHGGEFPRDFGAILALPGVGPYTAGAICSIAFNEPKPILDGNVIRVLTRVLGITKNPRENKTNSKLWQLAEELVIDAAQTKPVTQPPRNCSHLNQSLMELGALICTPKQPRCELCPISRHCAAYRQGCVDQIPNLGRRATATHRRFAAFVAEHRGRLLVRQRPAGTVNAHLWEFPNIETTKDGSEVKLAARALFGVTPTSLKPFCIIKHSITRYRITCEVFLAEIGNRGGKPIKPGRWLTLDELGPLTFTSAHRRILGMLGALKK